jgi:anti-sigma regulatory factor (Ser/Thr protein kinase)
MECDRLRLVAELIVPADVTLLTVCRMVLAGVGSGLPLSDQALDDLKLVLSEICAGAMERTATPGGTVEIAFRYSDTEIEVTVGDHAPGVPADGPGLGVPLLRQLCSRLDVDPRPDGPGTMIRLARAFQR